MIVGSGPGIGSHVAAHFARNGFEKMILLSRDAERLINDALIVKTAAPRVLIDTVPVNLAQIDQVRLALKKVEELLDDTPLECVLFNAARSGPSEMLDFPTKSFQQDLQVRVHPRVATWHPPG